MRKAIFRIIAIWIAVFSLVKCDKYEFPESPYPRIETLPVVDVSETGATFKARITQLGQKKITDHGFIWGLHKNLRLYNEDKVQLGPVQGTGEFTADVRSGLHIGETYFVRPFAVTEDYVVYGEYVSFTSEGSTPPVILSFSPLEGTWGDTITIKGNYFSALPANNIVKFGTVKSTVVASNDSTILCIVPDNIETLLVSVYVQVTENTTEASSKFQLTVPKIDDFTPLSGTFLDEIIIQGSNFGALKTHVVTIGGHVAEVVESSRTFLKVKIPLEVDLKTNQIQLTLNQQTTTAANSFTMLPPTITSLSKNEGRIGDEVEITGENFNPRLMGNLVLFGESQAEVITATKNSIKVILTNGVYPQRLSTVKVTVVEQTATAGSTFKLLDVWLKKSYTPIAEVNNGGFAIANIGYFIDRSNTYSYDPVANQWAQKADFPGESRFNAITFAAAGQGFSGAGGSGLQDLWRYSPSADVWTRRNDFPDERLGNNGTGAGDKGYTTQGFGGPVQMSEYDPGSDTWRTIGEILNANFTEYPHHPYTVFTMDNRIFVFLRKEYNYTSVDNYIYEFDIITGKWTRRAAYFDERSIGFSINGTGYIAGFEYIHEYNLTTNTITLKKVPMANDNWGMEYLFTANNKAYFLGAWTNSRFELWEFDPAYLQ
jgi:hypothetical protein